MGGHYFLMFSAKLSPCETVVDQLCRPQGKNLGQCTVLPAAKCDATIFFKSWLQADFRHVLIFVFRNSLFLEEGETAYLID